MANWYGAARSNYVKVADMPGLQAALEPWPVSIRPEAGNPDLVCFLSEEQDSGGWPSFATVEVQDPAFPEDSDCLVEDEIEFDPEVQILPFLEPGQVLIMMEAGHEKLRYITGSAVAYCQGKPLVALNLNDIYVMAHEAFGVPRNQITEVSY